MEASIRVRPLAGWEQVDSRYLGDTLSEAFWVCKGSTPEQNSVFFLNFNGNPGLITGWESVGSRLGAGASEVRWRHHHLCI